MQRLADALAVYLERRMARIFLLGIVSGFPWVLIASSLSLWLKEEGLSRSAIGWAGLIFGVYAFNFLWAPLIDRVRLPWLSARIGQRRAWIVVLQAVILLCLVLWSMTEPTTDLAAVVAIGLVIAVASATQDITIDALRIEQIGRTEGEAMAAGAATAVVGWWTRLQARRDRRPGDRRGLSERGRRALLAGDLPRARECRGALQHRPPVRARGAGGGAHRHPGRGPGQDRRTPRRFGPLGRAAAWLGGSVVGRSRASSAARRGARRRAARLRLPVQDRRGLPRAHVPRLLPRRSASPSRTSRSTPAASAGSSPWRSRCWAGCSRCGSAWCGHVRIRHRHGADHLLFAALAWSGRSEALFAAAVVMDDLTSAFATVTFVAFISMLVDRPIPPPSTPCSPRWAPRAAPSFAASSGELVDWLEGDWAPSS